MKALYRLTKLVGAILIGIAVFGLRRLRGPLSTRQRAEWLHWTCKFVLRALGVRVIRNGQPPSQGLLVSNHLSYLDIVAYSASAPCVFVSKAEVRSWPLIGLAASLSGTVFLDRSSRASTAVTAEKMQQLLMEGVPVLLFPEGTSTDGSEVLKFHPSLFEPAIVHSIPVSSAAIRYLDEDGYCERDLCYYGDIHFAPHLWSTLGCRERVSIRLDYGTEARTFADRRAAANITRDEIVALREQQVSSQILF